jgi:dTDP-4-amino-4,6-dideoxygalactose transaminase
VSPKVPLSRPHLTGNELVYVERLLASGRLGADGEYSRRVLERLGELTGSAHTLLTNSCSSALEVAACLLDLAPGDEVIVPSYTFVTTVSSFARFGARPVYADVRSDTCNLDERAVEALVTKKTRAIVAVHYAGVPAELNALLDIAARHDLVLIEDAAQALGAQYRGKPIGAAGSLAAFSFHDTKNFVCGEGGALSINDATLVERAHIVRDKGTNRRSFMLGQTDKYTWVDMGASYVPSEISSAVLLAQLEAVDTITQRRREIYGRYMTGLAELESTGRLKLPVIPEGCTSNYHLFHVLLAEPRHRPELLAHLTGLGIGASFHYVPLHSSPQGKRLGGDAFDLPVTDFVGSAVVRLPLFADMTPNLQDHVIDAVHGFFRDR